MNKLKTILFVCAAMFMFNACNDDDSVTTNDLIGNWRLLSYSAIATTNETGNGSNVMSESSLTGADLMYEAIFSQTTYAASGTYDINGSITVNGPPEPDFMDVYTVSRNGTYTTNGGTISTTGPFLNLEVNGLDINNARTRDESGQFTISGNGQLVITQTETYTLSEMGGSQTVVVNSIYTWEPL